MQFPSPRFWIGLNISVILRKKDLRNEHLSSTCSKISRENFFLLIFNWLLLSCQCCFALKVDEFFTREKREREREREKQI